MMNLLQQLPPLPQDAVAWQVINQKVASTGPGRYDLLLIGDSPAQGWPADSLSPLRVANFGVGGDQTQHVLWRLATPELVKIKPRKVLVVVGTNNLAAGNPPCAIIEGIKEIFTRISANWPAAQIVYLDIPPRGPNYTYRNDARLEINSTISLLRDIKDINVDERITCDWQSSCNNYSDDRLHFSTAGYDVLGTAVKAALFQE